MEAYGSVEKKYRYVVLYIPGTEGDKLTNILRRYIHKDRGEVFYPCMECYRRDDKKIHINAIFPGYVFLYTDLNMKEVHQIVREHRKEIKTALRELALSERRMENENFLTEKDDGDEIYELSDVSEDEAEFLDYLRKGNGLLTMSRGYEDESKGYIVMEGPLKIYEDKIKDVNKHNRKAFLEFEINGRRARAGFHCLPKAHWFPQGDTELVRFEDGTEADLGELRRSIMSIQ